MSFRLINIDALTEDAFNPADIVPAQDVAAVEAGVKQRTATVKSLLQR